MHSAKGQEWTAVYLLNAVDGCVPSDLATGSAAEIEEERRLFYVAMTRAKCHLSLLVPQRFHVSQQRKYGDRHLYASLTRFVPPDVAALFDRDGPAAEPCAAPLCGPAPVIDVGAQVRGLF
jgi:DNA helicase-2/ATP-dependent DNA helicase PcrA